jgi:hypothetical protein
MQYINKSWFVIKHGKTQEDIAREVDELIVRAHTPKRKKK